MWFARIFHTLNFLIQLFFKCLRKIIEMDPDFQQNIKFFHKIFDRFAKDGNLWIVNMLEYAGIDTNSPLCDQTLQVAAQNGHLEIVTKLIQMGFDPNKHDDMAIKLAALNGHLNVVEILLSAGAKVNPPGDDTPLQNACRNGHLDVVECLDFMSADLHANKDRALYLALRNEHKDVTLFLLHHGCTFNMKWKNVPDHMRVFCLEHQPIDIKSATKTL